MLKEIRWVSIVSSSILAFAAGMSSLLAFKSASDSWASPLLSLFSWLQLGRFSEGSTFGHAGMLSALFCIPIVLPAFTGNVAHILLTYQSKWGERVDFLTRLKAIVASIVIILFTALAMSCCNGGDVRVFKFGSSLLCMVLLGWTPYALFGVIFAYGFVGLWKSITHD